MGLIVVLVFLGAVRGRCSADARPGERRLSAGQAGSTPRSTRLWPRKRRKCANKVVNLRKSELLSGIPWLNRKLLSSNWRRA